MSELVNLLLGRNHTGRIIVVTPRGVEIPIGNADGWTVVEFTRLLNEIDGLPETEHPFGAMA